MSSVFAVPYRYLNDVGYKECAMIIYLSQISKESIDVIAKYTINKTEMSNTDTIRFLPCDEISTIIENLYRLGFVFYHKSKGRKTRIVSMSIFNIVLFELLGLEQYKNSLIDYDDDKYCGKYIPKEVLSSLDFSFPNYPSMFENGKYIKYTDDIDKVRSYILNMYNFNPRKLFGFIKDKTVFPISDCKKFNIEFLFGFGKKSPFYNEKECYKTISVGGELAEPVVEESNSFSTENETPSVSKKELARNDYIKYCEYLNIGKTMRKPVLEWTSTDFVSYFYCGLAKINEKQGDFVFPNFAKDCSQINNLINRYGKKRLNRVIYLMVKNTDEMISYCKFKDFNPSIGTLCVDWIFSKMLDFANYCDKERAMTELSRMISYSTTEENQQDCLKKQASAEKLLALRKNFNENKEIKNG